MVSLITLTLLWAAPSSSAEDLRSNQELRDYCTQMWNAPGARRRREYVARELDREAMVALYADSYQELDGAVERAADVLSEYLPGVHSRWQVRLAEGGSSEDLTEISIGMSRDAARLLQRSPENFGIGLGPRWYSFGHPLIREEATNASEFYNLSGDFCLLASRWRVTREELGSEPGAGCPESSDDEIRQLTGAGPFRNVLEPAVRIARDDVTGAATLSVVITACLTHYEGIRGWVRPRAYVPSIGEYLEQTVLEACVQTTLSTSDGENVTRTRRGTTVTEAIRLGLELATRRNFAQLNGSINQGPYGWDDILGYEPPDFYCDWMEEFDRRASTVSNWSP